MINSIQQFQENGIGKIEKVTSKFLENPSNIAEYVKGITDNMVEFGLSLIKEGFEDVDEYIRKTPNRRKNWVIVRKDEVQLLTSLGTVKYKKTLFKNKVDGHCEYLLDKLMNLGAHERISEDALAGLLEEATQTSYTKSGNVVSISESVSKQTVKNKIHELKFIPEQENELKREVEYLYIDADEDHVSLQFEERKGDLAKVNGYKSNTVLSKIVYVYEGKENEHPSGGKKRLINAKYFSGVYEGSFGNESLWKEVSEYIKFNYDVDKIKRIFINGDGALWIKAGTEYIEKSTFVIDKFHLNKYINQVCNGLEEEKRDELRSGIFESIERKDYELLEAMIDTIEGEIPGDVTKQFESSKKFLLRNFKYIKNGIYYKNHLCGCSAEGHVSHILSNRLSSRPMGWSKTGVDKVSKLRAFKANGGDFLQLVRYQKQNNILKIQEKEEIGMRELRKSFENKVSESKKYIDRFSASIASRQIKKMVYLSQGVKGL